MNRPPGGASCAGRMGAALKGHLLLFDRPPPPTYPPDSGTRLLAIVVALELALGPRLGLLSWLSLPLPPARVRVPAMVAAALVAARLLARVSYADLGLRPWRAWTPTEKHYFWQVVSLALAVFGLLYGPQLAAAIGRAGRRADAASIMTVQLLWGFYQERSSTGDASDGADAALGPAGRHRGWNAAVHLRPAAHRPSRLGTHDRRAQYPVRRDPFDWRLLLARVRWDAQPVDSRRVHGIGNAFINSAGRS